MCVVSGGAKFRVGRGEVTGCRGEVTGCRGEVTGCRGGGVAGQRQGRLTHIIPVEGNPVWAFLIPISLHQP